MAKPWILLTPARLKSKMTSKEVTDFGKSVTDGEPDDRIIPILASVSQDVRGRIKSWTQNTVSADDTLIPAEFEMHALALARWEVLTSIPGYQPGSARETSYKDATAFFRDVARGINRPEPADDAVSPEVPSEKPAGAQWTAPGTRTGRDRMNGL